MANPNTFSGLLQLASTYATTAAEREDIITLIPSDRLEDFLQMVTEVQGVNANFKAEINKQLNEIRTKKQLNMLTMRIDSLNANFISMFLSMTKNPFKEKNIMFSGLTENGESYEMFKKEVLFISFFEPSLIYY